jgi:ribose transport system ATP-binding protein
MHANDELAGGLGHGGIAGGGADGGTVRHRAELPYALFRLEKCAVASDVLLEAVGITKRFPGVQALDGVSLSVRRGEVLAVIGENGAGKSTLMKVLAGIYAPDAGQLRLEGVPLRLASVREALARGIVLIHQELNLADNLDVAANLFLGRELLQGGWLGWLDRPVMNQQARRLLDRVGLPVSPAARVGDLPLGQRQLVEIARALALDARILIMDEPTSSLTQRETDRLFEVIADLKRAGVTMVYISHRLAEVRQIADRVVVLRDGRNSGTLDRAELTHDAMVRLMVGRDVRQFYRRQHAPANAIRLEVRQLVFAGSRAPFSFVVRAGEVVSLAGLVGAGRTELAEALFGLRPISGGSIQLDGQELCPRRPAQAIAAGLLLAPEDRRLCGLVLEDSVQHNLALPNLDQLSRLRLVSPGRERQLARDLCHRLRVRTPRLDQPVGLLSGGNQQKVVLGKWLARRPRLLILDEPTRGVDIGARSEIYALIDQLAGSGVAILLISSDLEEVLGISDRVLVLHQGRLAGELSRPDLSEEAIMTLATGGG